MKSFSALLAIWAGNSPASGEFPAQRPVTRSFDVSMICGRISDWVNTREAGDLRRYRAPYDVIIMDMHSVAWMSNIFYTQIIFLQNYIFF